MNATDTQLRRAGQALVDACYEAGSHKHREARSAGGEVISVLGNLHHHGADLCILCREHGHRIGCPVAEMEAELRRTP